MAPLFGKLTKMKITKHMEFPYVLFPFLDRVDILLLYSSVIFLKDKTFWKMIHFVSKYQKTKNYLEEGWVIANYLFIMCVWGRCSG